MNKKIILSELNIEPLLNMRKLLQNILKGTQIKDEEIEGLAAVQAFEISYELAWHICQKVLKYYGEEARFPRDIFRSSKELGLINNLEKWFEFMNLRNETSHSYNYEIIEEVSSILPKFVKEFDFLIKNLQKLK